jgi:sugar lactone lactonase YvrE
LYYGAIVTAVNAAGSTASSMSTGVQFSGVYTGSGSVTTVANSGFGNLYGLSVDSGGNIYVADYGGFKVWVIPSGGSPSVFAGTGVKGILDGPVGSAKFDGIGGVAVNAAGTIVYVADYGNSRIRKITGGNVTTIAGAGGGYVDGASNVARFYYPSGIALDSTETLLFIGDKLTHRIRVVTIATGAVTTLAGGANSTVAAAGSFADGTGSSASFYNPLGICVDSNNNIYVADQANQRIRKVTYPGGVVTTIAGDGTAAFLNGTGTGARFRNPFGVAIDSYGILYVADKDSYRIRQITGAGVVTTFAGSGTYSSTDNANKLLASFTQVTDVAVGPSRTLYVTQYGTSIGVRQISLP